VKRPRLGKRREKLLGGKWGTNSPKKPVSKLKKGEKEEKSHSPKEEGTSEGGGKPLTLIFLLQRGASFGGARSGIFHPGGHFLSEGGGGGRRVSEGGGKAG